MNKEYSNVPFLNDPSDLFSSYDIGMSAGLVSAGFHLLRIDKNRGTKALFLFGSSERLIDSAQMYWRGELQVDALSYFNALKNIKNQLYSQQ